MSFRFFRPDPRTDAPGVAVAVDLPDSPLADAATVRQGVSPWLMGLALRFGDAELYLCVKPRPLAAGMTWWRRPVPPWRAGTLWPAVER